MYDHYGIVANVCRIDRCLRLGSKAYLIGGTGGEGWDRFIWWGMSRGGRMIKKWAATKKFTNFRCAWFPKHIHEDAYYLRGNKKKVKEIARELNKAFGNENLNA